MSGSLARGTSFIDVSLGVCPCTGDHFIGSPFHGGPLARGTICMEDDWDILPGDQSARGTIRTAAFTRGTILHLHGELFLDRRSGG